MRRLVRIVVVIVAIMLSGCDRKASKEKVNSDKKELLFYCGAGIRPPVSDIINMFSNEYNVKIIPDYAGSEVLLSKISLIQQGDLYMPGDRYYIKQADMKEMILSRRSVCYWVPTIFVQKNNPKEIRELKDLLRPGIKLGLGDPNVCAIGRTSKQLFDINHIPYKEIRKNLVYQSLTVNELGMQIQAKTLDAVIIWDAMAKFYSKYGDEVPIDAEKNVISTVDIGVLKFTKHKEIAEKFVDFITSEPSQEIFKKYDYSTKPPE